MASIHSIEEDNFIANMQSSNSYWVGGVDFNQNGVWGWTDGSNFDYSNWLEGQPDGGEYYLIIENDDIEGYPLNWRDWYYDNNRPYVCQLIM